MFRRFFASLASFASLVGLVFAIHPSGQPLDFVQGVLIGAATCFFVLNLYLEYQDYQKNQPQSFEDENQINEYMFNWISNGGRVVIFTHDMTWVNNQNIKDLLLAKARKNELTICLPDSIPLTEELKEEGTAIFTYSELDYIPQSRFTIIHEDRGDAKVAVGRKVNGKHVIKEYGLGEHAVFSIANDLVKILKKLNEVSKEQK